MNYSFTNVPFYDLNTDVDKNKHDKLPDEVEDNEDN